MQKILKITYLLISLLVGVLIYSNIDILNIYPFAFLKIGSLALVIAGIFTLYYLAKLYMAQNIVVKSLASVAMLLLIIHISFNQQEYFSLSKISSIELLNPITDPACETRQQLTRSFIDSDFISKKTSEIEQLILKYTNIEREKEGLNALAIDKDFSDISRAHSLDMAENNYFSHTNPEGEEPTDRAKRNGYSVRKTLGNGWVANGIGENIQKMPTGLVKGIGFVSNNADTVAKVQVQAWMDSPGHKANILNERYDVIGIGVVYDGTYYYSTQNFK